MPQDQKNLICSGNTESEIRSELTRIGFRNRPQYRRQKSRIHQKDIEDPILFTFKRFKNQVTVEKIKLGKTKYLTKRNIQELVGDLLQGSGQLVEKEHCVLGLDGAAQLEGRLCDGRN